MLAVRWYLRFGQSYRDLEELLAERGIELDHATLDRWVQRFTQCRCVGCNQGTVSAGAAEVGLQTALLH